MVKKITWIAAIITFFITFSINKEIGMFYGCSIIVFLGFIFSKKRMWALIPALFVSWIWVYIGRDFYSGYADVFRYSIWGVSLFPIFTWPAILFLGYLGVYPLIKTNEFWTKWLAMAIIYCFGIILFEYLGYNFGGVRLDAGMKYPGWPILNIFHCPWWMQIAYFLNGIIYYGLVALIDYKILLKQK